MKRKTPFAGKEHDLTGYAALDFAGRDDFAAFALKSFNCSPDRFEPMALRFYVKGGEPVITLYAMDKQKKEKNKLGRKKTPVRKMKSFLTFTEFILKIKQFDFTVLAKGVDIEKFVVVK